MMLSNREFIARFPLKIYFRKKLLRKYKSTLKEGNKSATHFTSRMGSIIATLMAIPLMISVRKWDAFIF
jgi:hypothetical protein